MRKYDENSVIKPVQAIINLKKKKKKLQSVDDLAYSMAWEMCMVIRYDSSTRTFPSEIPRDELDGEDCKAKDTRQYSRC